MNGPGRGAKVFAATFLAAGALVSAFAVEQAWFPGRRFDPGVWRDEASLTNGARHDMAVRLESRGTLIGKSREEVVEMLGEPRRRLRDRTRDPDGPDLLYQLGSLSALGPDMEWFAVRLGADGRVTGCYRWTD